jgi:hypothetical protein
MDELRGNAHYCGAHARKRIKLSYENGRCIMTKKEADHFG